MSTSRLARARRAVPAGNDHASHALPPTVSAAALLDMGSDRHFRTLVNDLFTIASRMEIIRTHLGRRMGLSGPQYSLLIAIAHLQGERGVSVSALAQAMHVSSAFIASETGKMARLRLLLKQPNPQDRRGVLLSLASAGREKISHIGAEIRTTNDLFFGALDAGSFFALSAAAAALVQSSSDAVRYIDAAGSAARAAGKAMS